MPNLPNPILRIPGEKTKITTTLFYYIIFAKIADFISKNEKAYGFIAIFKNKIKSRTNDSKYFFKFHVVADKGGDDPIRAV